MRLPWNTKQCKRIRKKEGCHKSSENFLSFPLAPAYQYFI